MARHTGGLSLLTAFLSVRAVSAVDVDSVLPEDLLAMAEDAAATDTVAPMG